jgi:hypothetical protein
MELARGNPAREAAKWSSARWRAAARLCRRARLKAWNFCGRGCAYRLADTDIIRFHIRIRPKFGYPNPDPGLQIEFRYIHFDIHFENEYEYGYPYNHFCGYECRIIRIPFPHFHP